MGGFRFVVVFQRRRQRAGALKKEPPDLARKRRLPCLCFTRAAGKQPQAGRQAKVAAKAGSRGRVREMLRLPGKGVAEAEGNVSNQQTTARHTDFIPPAERKKAEILRIGEHAAWSPIVFPVRQRTQFSLIAVHRGDINRTGEHAMHKAPKRTVFQPFKYLRISGENLHGHTFEPYSICKSKFRPAILIWWLLGIGITSPKKGVARHGFHARHFVSIADHCIL
jgi:hypothetical protein